MSCLPKNELSSASFPDVSKSKVTDDLNAVPMCKSGSSFNTPTQKESRIDTVVLSVENQPHKASPFVAVMAIESLCDRLDYIDRSLLSNAKKPLENILRINLSDVLGDSNDNVPVLSKYPCHVNMKQKHICEVSTAKLNYMDGGAVNQENKDETDVGVEEDCTECSCKRSSNTSQVYTAASELLQYILDTAKEIENISSGLRHAALHLADKVTSANVPPSFSEQAGNTEASSNDNGSVNALLTKQEQPPLYTIVVSSEKDNAVDGVGTIAAMTGKSDIDCEFIHSDNGIMQFFTVIMSMLEDLSREDKRTDKSARPKENLRENVVTQLSFPSTADQGRTEESVFGKFGPCTVHKSPPYASLRLYQNLLHSELLKAASALALVSEIKDVVESDNTISESRYCFSVNTLQETATDKKCFNSNYAGDTNESESPFFLNSTDVIGNPTINEPASVHVSSESDKTNKLVSFLLMKADQQGSSLRAIMSNNSASTAADSGGTLPVKPPGPKVKFSSQENNQSPYHAELSPTNTDIHNIIGLLMSANRFLPVDFQLQQQPQFSNQMYDRPYQTNEGFRYNQPLSKNDRRREPGESVLSDLSILAAMSRRGTKVTNVDTVNNLSSDISLRSSSFAAGRTDEPDIDDGVSTWLTENFTQYLERRRKVNTRTPQFGTSVNQDTTSCRNSLRGNLPSIHNSLFRKDSEGSGPCNVSITESPSRSSMGFGSSKVAFSTISEALGVKDSKLPHPSQVNSDSLKSHSMMGPLSRSSHMKDSVRETEKNVENINNLDLGASNEKGLSAGCGAPEDILVMNSNVGDQTFESGQCEVSFDQNSEKSTKESLDTAGVESSKNPSNIYIRKVVEARDGLVSEEHLRGMLNEVCVPYMDVGSPDFDIFKEMEKLREASANSPGGDTNKNIPKVSCKSQYEGIIGVGNSMDLNSASGVPRDSTEIARVPENIFVFVCTNVLFRYVLIKTLDINVKRLMRFFMTIQSLYRESNPYHNSIHAADVLQTTHIYLTANNVHTNFSDIEILSLLFSALVHDVGHLGVNNSFLSRIDHPIAVLYNHKSPLENMHAAFALHVLSIPECNFLEGSAMWCRDQMEDFRNLVTDMISGTDMKFHSSIIHTVNEILEDGVIEDAEIGMLIKAILHAADLSNPMKPRRLYLNWMRRVTEEFWMQGDEEKRIGIPVSVMCDRETSNIPAAQVGFISVILKPFMSSFNKLLPDVWMERMESNYDYMVEVLAKEKRKKDEEEWKTVTLAGNERENNEIASKSVNVSGESEAGGKVVNTVDDIEEHIFTITERGGGEEHRATFEKVLHLTKPVLPWTNPFTSPDDIPTLTHTDFLTSDYCGSPKEGSPSSILRRVSETGSTSINDNAVSTFASILSIKLPSSVTVSPLTVLKPTASLECASLSSRLGLPRSVTPDVIPVCVYSSSHESKCEKETYIALPTIERSTTIYPKRIMTAGLISR